MNKVCNIYSSDRFQSFSFFETKQKVKRYHLGLSSNISFKIIINDGQDTLITIVFRCAFILAGSIDHEIQDAILGITREDSLEGWRSPGRGTREECRCGWAG